ncbi:hypothetical protein GCM10012280_21260 [Wenjunlia tyrosinilytica]|uniref:Zinc finger CGNR domain-containing protein n=1 Tax=Wenjunlia tyrosinilytica TaxID=1544741 RepID=A0A917ZMM7_9ACTN|nr:hypothetical protein GCM10012280_21260 [Wenjunlia tyrosinilytica]
MLSHGRIRRVMAAEGPGAETEVDDPSRLAAWLAAEDLLQLVERGRHRIRECANGHCILHFFDTSQNGRRRWCSMAVCGNRAKVSRHYERTKRTG